MREPLWKGRFSKGPSEELQRFSRSLHFDARLWRQDVRTTRAHAASLERAGLLSPQEREDIDATLDEVAAAFEAGSFEFAEADEDIHTAIERFLTDRLGETGAKIHAGRSRNDLVVTDLRLWLKGAIAAIAEGVLRLQIALRDQARRHESTLAPGYTHLQRAQPVLLPHLLLAHAFALARDVERLFAAYRRADVSCLGAAALAGTTLPLDARETARDLGFARVFDNAADAVSARDFACEFLATAGILGIHLSRLGEEIVIWSSAEFGFVTLDDSYSTGSSIMPQKKNPDIAELARAKSARITGHLVHLLGVIKGLPLAYNRDLQEDKEPVFDAADSLIEMLPAMAGVVETMTFDHLRLDEAARGQSAGATDLAEALVMKGVPFREAHEAVGKLVARAEALATDLTDLDEDTVSAFHPELTVGMLQMLDPRVSVNARSSHGGTSPARIAEQLDELSAIIRQEKETLAQLATGSSNGPAGTAT
ncbi:MAG: argininosuccinate lyase [Actinomycetota bacterium]|nr:argininosuccinate lyase [Actinomycetota bacterium]